MPDKKTKVLALSSGGGQWAQLMRLHPAFANSDVVVATLKEGLYLATIGLVLVAFEALTGWLPVVVGMVALVWSLPRSTRVRLRFVTLNRLPAAMLLALRRLKFASGEVGRLLSQLQRAHWPTTGFSFGALRPNSQFELAACSPRGRRCRSCDGEASIRIRSLTNTRSIQRLKARWLIAGTY